MRADWVVCIDEGACTYIVEGRKYLVEWQGDFAKILKVQNNPFHPARGRTYKRERFKLVSTMKEERIPQITHYIIIDEYGDVARYQTSDGVEEHLSDVYEFDTYENDQILFVYDNGNVTQKYLVDVVSHKPELNPVFK